jgi:hypothetical protein
MYRLYRPPPNSPLWNPAAWSAPTRNPSAVTTVLRDGVGGGRQAAEGECGGQGHDWLGKVRQANDYLERG